MTDNESNLIKHARRELEIIGEELAVVEAYLKIVQIFSDMGHSGGSASIAIPTITKLLSFENLAPLTDNEDEWMFINEYVWGAPGGIYQNRRNGACFSNDEGKTYYHLDNRNAIIESIHYEKIQSKDDINVD